MKFTKTKHGQETIIQYEDAKDSDFSFANDLFKSKLQDYCINRQGVEYATKEDFLSHILDEWQKENSIECYDKDGFYDFAVYEPDYICNQNFDDVNSFEHKSEGAIYRIE